MSDIEDTSWDFPMTWREFRDLVEGLKIRARGNAYEGPQAQWVNPIWDEIIAPPTEPYEHTNPKTQGSTFTAKGSAKDRLANLSIFAEKSEDK